MNTLFNYNTFIRYYSNRANVTQEPLPRPTVQFFDGNTGIIYDASLGNTSITVNGTKYYIKQKNNNTIRFSLPTTIPGYPGLWDVHYHFGIRKIKINHKSALSKRQLRQKEQNVIYFHKTIQQPHLQNKKHNNCYFFPDQPIHDVVLIPDIDCLETTTSKMTKNFPVGSEDLAVITELIRRPFYGIQYGGSRKKTKKVYRKGARKTKRRKALIHSS